MLNHEGDEDAVFNRYLWGWFTRSVVSDSLPPWTVAPQVPLSMGFPRQKHWSVLPFSSPGDLPDPGTEPTSPALGRTTEPPAEAQLYVYSLMFIFA